MGHYLLIYSTVAVGSFRKYTFMHVLIDFNEDVIYIDVDWEQWKVNQCKTQSKTKKFTSGLVLFTLKWQTKIKEYLLPTILHSMLFGYILYSHLISPNKQRYCSFYINTPVCSLFGKLWYTLLVIGYHSLVQIHCLTMTTVHRL